MGYHVTTDQLIARFESEAAVAHLTDASFDSADTDVLNAIINESEGFVYSYLARRYKTPVITVGDPQLEYVLEGIVLDIAQYRLLARGNNITDAKQQVYDHALKWCEGVADGSIPLPAEAQPDPTEVRSPVASWGSGDFDEDNDSTNRRIFTRDSLSNL